MLQKIGVSEPEVEVMVEDIRKTYLEAQGTEGQRGVGYYLNPFRSPSTPPGNSNTTETSAVTPQPTIPELVIAPMPVMEDSNYNNTSSLPPDNHINNSSAVVPLTI